jgi:hypothetical protein
MEEMQGANHDAGNACTIDQAVLSLVKLEATYDIHTFDLRSFEAPSQSTKHERSFQRMSHLGLTDDTKTFV